MGDRRCRGLWLGVALGLFLIGTAQAVEAQQTARARPRAPQLDPTLGKRLYEAVEAMNQGRSAAARSIVEGIDLARLGPYAKSRVAQILAAVEQVEGRYPQARAQLELALASGGLDPVEADSARFQVAQLLVAEERYAEGARMLEGYLASTPTPRPAAHYLLGMARYQAGDVAGALAPATRALELEPNPQDSWIQFVLALRIERQEYAQAEPLLRELVVRHPDEKRYWLELSAVYGLRGDFERALVPLRLAYHAGLLAEEAELRRVAELELQTEIPQRAARLLAKVVSERGERSEVRTLETLANCFIAADAPEAALASLEQAVRRAPTSALRQRLAELHLQREEWDRAAALLRLCLSDEKRESPGRTHLLLGIALLNQSRWPEARASLERAERERATRDDAKVWLRYLSNAERAGAADGRQSG